MTVKATIESIQRILAGGNVRSSFQWHENDIKASLSRAVAAVLKLEVVNIAMPLGSNIPPFQAIATYENVPVTDVAGCENRSQATLPATPMALPEQMGIYQVTKRNCCDFIVPVQPGMMTMATNVTHTALSAMLADAVDVYEPNGTKLTFNRSAEALGGSVDMKLVIMDLMSLDDYAQLPVPQDMGSTVINMVVRELQGRPRDDSNDANSSN